MTTDGEEISAEMTNIGEGTTIAAAIPTTGTTTTVVLTIMTGTKIFGEMTTGNEDNHGIISETTSRRMSAKSDGDRHTTIDVDLDLRGLNHRVLKSSKNDS